MERIDKYKERCEFHGEDSEVLAVMYDNRGDPYSEGATFEFREEGSRTSVCLKKSELRELHETLGNLLEGMKRR